MCCFCVSFAFFAKISFFFSFFLFFPLETYGLIMMISYGVFQERKTRLTYNVEYDVWEASIYGLVCYQHTLVYLATYVTNYYSMPEVLSVASTMDFME